MEAASALKILIVDDSEFSAECIKDFLSEHENYEVIASCQSAGEALEVLKSSKIQVAIVDVVMPDKSGIEFTKEIQESNPETQVILISSLAGEALVIDAIGAGASDFIQKPFTKEHLLNSINKITLSIG